MKLDTKTVRKKEMQTELQYREQLARHIISVVARARLSLCSIVKRAGGAYPTDVLAALQGLMDRREIVDGGAYYDLTDYAEQIGRRSGREEALEKTVLEGQESVDGLETERCFHEPHPADYDWRYSSSSLAELSRRALAVIQGGGKVALLGCPTLFPVLARLTSRVTLFDKSASAIDDLERIGFREGVVRHDLFDPLCGGEDDYDLAIADPPWYPPFHKAFIVRANELLGRSGVLILSVLPWLTRPGAIDDRAELLQFGAQAGFDVSGFEEGVLGYRSPEFERAALAMRGIECGEWRRGDLSTFRKIKDGQQLPTPRPLGEPEWDDFKIGRAIVKLRRREEPLRSEFRAKPVDNTPVLASVSRRYPLRSKIDVWTSDNRAYMVSRLDIAREALDGLQAGETAGAIVRRLTARHSLLGQEAESLSNLVASLDALNSQEG